MGDVPARNPLTIDLVVPAILSHVPSMKDLLVFRQVCRIWREFATPLISFRSLELPLITFKEEEVQAGAEGDAGLLSSLSKYVDYLECDSYPKITFCNFHFDGISMDHPIVERFVEKFGHTVKKLYLNKIDADFYSKEPPSEEAEDTEEETISKEPLKFRKLLLSCPDLEELFLGCDQQGIGKYGFLRPDDDFKLKIKRVAWVPFHGFDYLNPHYKFISDIKKVCPSSSPREDARNMDRGFVQALSKSPYISTMKELEILRGYDGVLKFFCREEFQQKLRLTRLKFRVIGIFESQEFRRLLDTQKSSLESLIVEDWMLKLNYEGHNNATLELPRITFPDVMENLLVLNIGHLNPHGPHRKLPLQPLDFRRQFPVLKTLRFRGRAMNYDFSTFFAPGMAPQMALEVLVLPLGIKAKDLRSFGQSFPNVKELELQEVDDDLFHELWKQWPQMEALFLNDVAIPETSLTGLSSEQISIVDSLIKNGQEINITAEHPSILRFQNLKELRIMQRFHEAVGYLTDVCIHYTLSKLTKLEFLEVSSHRHKFTEEGINHLCNTRGLKWNKENADWRWLECKKDLDKEYESRPAFESFSSYHYQTT